MVAVGRYKGRHSSSPLLSILLWKPFYAPQNFRFAIAALRRLLISSAPCNYFIPERVGDHPSRGLLHHNLVNRFGGDNQKTASLHSQVVLSFPPKVVVPCSSYFHENANYIIAQPQRSLRINTVAKHLKYGRHKAKGE